MSTRILCLDFDGVIHSYKSGWQGVWTIGDPPVPGAIEFIREMAGEPDEFGPEARPGPFRVAILSSRSKYPLARTRMKLWLLKHGLEPGYFHDGLVYFPLFKPAAHLTIDDRAIQFKGVWPRLVDVLQFRAWDAEVIRSGKGLDSLHESGIPCPSWLPQNRDSRVG